MAFKFKVKAKSKVTTVVLTESYEKLTLIFSFDQNYYEISSDFHTFGAQVCLITNSTVLKNNTLHIRESVFFTF